MPLAAKRQKPSVGRTSGAKQQSHPGSIAARVQGRISDYFRPPSLWTEGDGKSHVRRKAKTGVPRRPPAPGDTAAKTRKSNPFKAAARSADLPGQLPSQDSALRDGARLTQRITCQRATTDETAEETRLGLDPTLQSPGHRSDGIAPPASAGARKPLPKTVAADSCTPATCPTAPKRAKISCPPSEQKVQLPVPEPEGDIGRNASPVELKAVQEAVSYQPRPDGGVPQEATNESIAATGPKGSPCVRARKFVAATCAGLAPPSPMRSPKVCGGGMPPATASQNLDPPEAVLTSDSPKAVLTSDDEFLYAAASAG